jgi:translation initiation factor IF-3
MTFNDESEGPMEAGTEERKTSEEKRFRINHQIRVPEIRLISPDGEQLGVVPTEHGLRLAKEIGLDLVEVAPNAKPPVCRLLDFGKFQYERNKKTAVKPKTITTKTIKLRPKTDQHDLATKLKHATRFLQSGDRVRFVMRLRGREKAYMDRWIEKMQEMIGMLPDKVNITTPPKPDGGAIVAVCEPVGSKASSAAASSATSHG